MQGTYSQISTWQKGKIMHWPLKPAWLFGAGDRSLDKGLAKTYLMTLGKKQNAKSTSVSHDNMQWNVENAIQASWYLQNWQ